MQPAAGAKIGLRQRQVLRDLVSHGGVGADGLVGFAGRQDELAVGDDVALAPRARSPSRGWYRSPSSSQTCGMTSRSQKLSHRWCGATVTRSAPVASQRAHRAPEQLRLVTGVGVGEEHELASRAARNPWRQAQGFPYHPSGSGSPWTQPHARIPGREPLDDGRGLVGGPIVHDQQLERLVGRGENRADHGLDDWRLRCARE